MARVRCRAEFSLSKYLKVRLEVRDGWGIFDANGGTFFVVSRGGNYYTLFCSNIKTNSIIIY